MKSFIEKLYESKKTYKFFVKVAGELPEKFVDTLETALDKYSIVSITNGKTTPITESPLDFPNLQNVEVTHYEVEVNYPTTSHVLENYLENCCNIPKQHIVVRGEFDPIEEIQKPADDKTPYESLINTEDMGGESAQENAGENRVMGLLKELEAARKKREIDPIAGMTPGESKDISPEIYVKSPLGSK